MNTLKWIGCVIIAAFLLCVLVGGMAVIAAITTAIFVCIALFGVLWFLTTLVREWFRSRKNRYTGKQ